MKLEDYEIEKFIGKGTFWEVYLTKKEGDSKRFNTIRSMVKTSQCRFNWISYTRIFCKSLKRDQRISIKDVFWGSYSDSFKNISIKEDYCLVFQNNLNHKKTTNLNLVLPTVMFHVQIHGTKILI